MNHKKPRVRKIKTKHVHKPAEQEGLEFESDMSLSPEEKEDMEEMESRGRIRRKAVANDMKLWPRGIVYYQLSSTLGLFSFVKLMNEEFRIKFVV